MKVIFSNTVPFFLAHGGTQTLLESLMRELQCLGVDVEPERWWDEKQTGDILHYMNRPNIENVRLAKQKKFKVLMTENLDLTASRSASKLFTQKILVRLAQAIFPQGILFRLSWPVYHELDAMVYVVPHEWEVAKYLFNATPTKGHIIPHGMPADVLRQLAESQTEDDYLISVATIHPRKNSVLLAQAAHDAQVPIVFLGKPYSTADPYFRQFQQLVDGKLVRYPGFVSDEEKARYLRGARGFALLSQVESGCIAVYEASAAGLPLFLSDLPWASKVYKTARGTKLVKPAKVSSVAPSLRDFYKGAHRQQGTTFPLLTWRQVAEQYLRLYEQLLRSP